MLRLAAVTATLLLVAACAHRAPPLHSVIDHQPPELVGTPFFPDTALYCGPATLATLLHASGLVDVSLESLVPALYTPGREGTLQVEMLAQARKHGRIPVQLEGRMQAIADALAEGLPVLVLQNLGTPNAPVWHYAVVVGLDAANDRVILRSGERRRQVEPAARFMRSWSLAERWAIVVVPPEQPPAFASVEAWLRAAAPAESAGQPALARRAYIGATQRWPESPQAWTALGNAQHRLDAVPAARRAWQHALALDPGFATARNNLDATEVLR